MRSTATGIGSMPGDNFSDAAQTVLGELGSLPHLAELPARGPHAALIGRTLAVVAGLSAELQPAGWRVTASAGVDQRRAVSLLAQDLDTLEELASSWTGTLKVQVAGPWTVAAGVEKSRGDKLLGDHGARRDLAQGLAEGVRLHVHDVHRRVPGAQIVVQLDEPALPVVLAGSVPTASGFSRHRSVSAHEVAGALDEVIDALVDAGAYLVLHCCAAGLPWALLVQTGVQAVSFDVALQPRSSDDEIAAWVDGGRSVWLGVIPSTEPPDTGLTDAALTRTVLNWWSGLGYTEPETVPACVVTPTCGLAGASPSWARSALSLATKVAQNLSADEGRIER